MSSDITVNDVIGSYLENIEFKNKKHEKQGYMLKNVPFVLKSVLDIK
jgi:hypothetical protein